MSITSKFKQVSIALVSTAAVAVALFGAANTASADEIYTVKSGDTLSQISYDFGLNGDYEGLAKANDIEDANLIITGQKLVIKSDGEIKKATQKEVNTLPEVNNNQTGRKVVSSNNQAKSYKSYTSNASGSEASAKAWIAARESGGSYSARNGQYIGKYQLSSSYLNGDYSAANQERAADNYVKSRYGSWSNAKSAWLSKGWY